MKITDSPALIVAIPFNKTEEAKLLESSSTFQPEIFTALVPVLVSSNQSARTSELPLLQGATSVTKMVELVTGSGVSSTTLVTFKVKVAVASGVLPIVESSTLTLTLKLVLVSKSKTVPALRNKLLPTISKAAASVPLKLRVFTPS